MKARLKPRRRSRLAPLLVGKSSPTASLYFENACQGWLLDGKIKKIASTVFASETTQLVFRHDAGVPAGFSRPRTVYFMDDYWHPDQNLPWQYRQKTKFLEHRAARFYMQSADWVGVSSDVLHAQLQQEYPHKPTGVLHPFWSEPLADLDHFNHPALDICFLGARSHASDLTLILPAIRAVLHQFPKAEFTLSQTHRLPADLAVHKRVNRMPQMGWQDYRKWVVKQRFHVALYPLKKGPFNAARSTSKMTEHAIVGAACLCSAHWKNGADRSIPVGDNPADWVQKLCWIAADRGVAKHMAQVNKTVASQQNHPETQQAVWQDLLFPK